MISVKKNFIYSGTLTVTGYIFPLLTFPYITRVLGVENIGIYNWFDSLISFFTIFSMLGINTLAIREIARVKNNQSELSKTYSSLLTLNLVITLSVIVVLVLLTFLIPKLYMHQNMMYVGCVRLLFNTFLVEWLYKGIEDFRFITIRSVVVRLIYVIAVFVFVKDADDFFLYFLLTALVVVINAVINISYSSSIVRFSFSSICIKPYIKPLFVLGLYQILTSMYTSFNVMYLGFVSTEIEVGYYTTAVKLYHIILAIFTAFTGVMLPRMSSLVAEGKSEQFRLMINKSIDVLWFFVMPLIVITIVHAPSIIKILAGSGYEGAILPMRLVMPLMLVVGYEQILIVQVLSPLKKDKAILINSIWGGCVALLMNILIVPHLGSVGSAIVWILSELIVLFSAQYYVKKYVGYKFPYELLLKSIVEFVPILVLNIVLQIVLSNQIFVLFIGSAITLIYYFVITCFVKKNVVINSTINSLLKKCHVRYQLP